jgi:hypothetical protein
MQISAPTFKRCRIQGDRQTTSESSRCAPAERAIFHWNAFLHGGLTGHKLRKETHMSDQNKQNQDRQKQPQDQQQRGESERKAEIRKGVQQDMPDKKQGQENTEYSGGT